jgi:2-haloacid dehalogenase
MPAAAIGSFAGRPTVLIFDVSETLIDFESISPLFERVFGDKRVMREWLGHLIMYSMTITLSGLYKNYWSLGGGLFQMVGAIHKVKVTSSDVEALQKAMKTMPAHEDRARSGVRCRGAVEPPPESRALLAWIVLLQQEW